ncbi:M48 family metalloprotease [Streptomyces europaeiscabiei]|uniref:M48 family metallopeptidase n=1 Tax=Streptomyces europaeiscabiei TaxID=146819 RepID=A0ABU4NCU4_9ACTN|nr:M48 family metallopeptidase [Streptomyces europaeiscabiei]MDX2525814.1 M48 family metallopeptidase [Streptomyces europaeiscabiei]MDX2772593.1 M48 family metallopeptidase [Streptomyces europaeiscabiei]MDX3543157.1 M48 family metallopeptidase [Streptomyces europaeiscabiei]MDX3552973.1 M48 family metallopeptidase [Streptomyces europaeiscabiei]MDX3667697.1 M48 family metallopeptidase [Streptomyces europaeiscabiei]
MGATLRALRALVLLAGFYLLGVILLAALAGADYLLHLHAPSSLSAKLYVVSVLLAIPLVRGLFMLRTPKGEDLPGLRVTQADEPELWRTVRELAEAVGTRAPSRIILTADLNAAVSEDARLLGLLAGPRHLYLGVPLLQGLTEAQLRAILAHELGHYSNADTRLAAITVRGRAQVLRTIGHFEERADKSAGRERARLEKKNAKAVAKGKKAKEIDTTGAGITYRAMAWIYSGYAKLYIRATLASSRRQEYAADAAAARIAGRDATSSALREIQALDAAFGFYMNSYATLGAEARLLPPRGEFFGGYGRMLSARQLELVGLRTELPTEPTSPYDSHPPIADRVERIEALPADGRTDEARGAALGLLTDPDRTLAALEDAVLAEDVLRFRRTGDWQELLDGSMVANFASLDTALHRALAMYTKDHPSLPGLLKVIDDGQLWQLARRLPLSDRAAEAQGRAFREFVRPALADALQSMVLAELSAHSRLRWEFSWSEPATVRLPPTPHGREPDLGAAISAAVADHPDTGPLRTLLPAPQDPANRETDAPR